MKDLPLILSVIGIVGSFVVGVLTLRKDSNAADAKAQSENNTTAITGLKEGADVFRGIAEDCRKECAELKAELVEAKDQLSAALRKITTLEETIDDLRR